MAMESREESGGSLEVAVGPLDTLAAKPKDLLMRLPRSAAMLFTFALAVLPLTSLQAQGSQVPPGRIYFTYAGATWSMNGDGSGKVALPTVVTGEPSRQLHGGRRWFLQFQPVTGTYPDGSPRMALAAVRDDGALGVLLANDADLQPFPGWPNPARWKFDDSKVSWVAMRWVGTTATTAGIHAADILFDGAGNVLGLATQPTNPLVAGSVVTVSNLVRPSINDHDWSPDNVKLAFTTTSDSASLRRLHVADTSAPVVTIQVLATSRPAKAPSWSPAAAKIAFQAAEFGGGIWSINATGTGEQLLVRTRSGTINGLLPPHWSQNGQHIVYGTWGNILGDDREDVYRAKADGAGKTNLTAELDTRALSGNPARPVEWR